MLCDVTNKITGLTFVNNGVVEHLNEGFEVANTEMFVDKIREEESSSCEPEVEGNPLVPQMVDSESITNLLR